MRAPPIGRAGQEVDRLHAELQRRAESFSRTSRTTYTPADFSRSTQHAPTTVSGISNAAAEVRVPLPPDLVRAVETLEMDAPSREAMASVRGPMLGRAE